MRRARPSCVVALTLTLLLSSVAAKRKTHQRNVNNRKRECETTTCQAVHADERDNCVLRCQSAECYEKVYGGNELEPGEIDAKRTRDFNACVTQEGRRKGQQAPAKPAAEAAPADAETADEASPESSDDEQTSESQVEL
tara:strand:+ start:7 stop:423 length:417 start_codon:yes stop_codon:yes gene_type:complete